MNKILVMRRYLTVTIILLLMGVITNPLTMSIEMKKSPMSTFYDGTTLYVGGNGPGNYSKIQDAIDNASDGDTVFVFDDSSPYYESIIINKSISLIGEDRNATILNGNGNNYIISIRTDAVLVEKFNITNGFDGIELKHVDNCVISKNNLIGVEYRTINVIWSNNNLVIDNYITGPSTNTGIINYGDNNNFTGNTIFNMVTMGIGIFYSENNSIYRNNIDTYRSFYNIRIEMSNTTSIVGNTINAYGSSGGREYSSVEIHGNKNTIEDNMLTYYSGEDGSGLHVYGTENVILRNSINSFSWVGIELSSSSRNNIISDNNIINNNNAIILSGKFNQIINNNFINNSHNAFFYFLSFFNKWDGNYWDSPRFIPYPIIGRLFLSIIPWINFDWHPAQEPYDIGV